MSFLVFACDDGFHLGQLVAPDAVLDLTERWPESGRRPRDVADLAQLGRAGLEVAASLAAGAPGGDLPFAGLGLLAPIPRPARNVFCVGRNYRDHIAEGARATALAPTTPPPLAPEFFTKSPACVIGHGAAVPLHRRVTDLLDYEAELAVIIGRGGADITPERAMEHVFGYAIINDVTGRDLQRRHGQWFKGKSLDRSCPFGPVVVLRAALGDAPDLAIQLRINGELRQDSRTSRLIFDIPTIIAALSAGMALEPGDIIATGTPSGVGYAMHPPRRLAAGDVMSVTIEGIGTLENAVVDA
ncbi:fumarylacetoacetate hydrolase family protein [Bosea vestrisii]|uniref:fumarylacetoacetate hydrolase family protein n=1 Tax=Bosea vestrisii TaxID=151416 RepID=UPI0024DF3DCB|nr:fumarylacetoacetate hydrolase family protein [Bosea vestrisii]WID95234.1 fumarylacetoacetate hydrolase family protein [Bosea vestrisii]